jgi:beta-galactosidase/beta-glucuronidase
MHRVFLLYVLVAAGLCRGQGLTTPWTADAANGHGWTEYPRPALVRSAWLNLNGAWDFAIAEAASPVPSRYDGKILVPYAPESALSGVKRSVMPNNRLWYHRSITLPPAWTGQRILLHFGAVNWDATVFLNGAVVGSHRGAFDSFSFDLTEFLRPGPTQDLVV